MTTITEEATEGVRVKPLEWNGGNFAHTPFGSFYHLVTANDGWLVLEAHEGSSTAYSTHKSEDAAKAYAQADYEARIRSALVAPQAEGRDTGLREALKTLLDCGNAVVGADPSDPDAAEAFDAKWPAAMLTPLDGQSALLGVPNCRLLNPEKWSRPSTTFAAVLPPGWPLAAPDEFFVRDDIRLAHDGFPAFTGLTYSRLPGFYRLAMPWPKWHSNDDTLTTIVNFMRVHFSRLGARHFASPKKPETDEQYRGVLRENGE